MARRIRYVTAVAPREARGLVAAVYAQLRADFGRVAEPLAVHSPAPELLAGAWGVVRETLLVGRVPRGVKASIAGTVSAVNRCPSCVDVHTMLARAAGYPEAARAVEGVSARAGAGARDRHVAALDPAAGPRPAALLRWAAATRSADAAVLRAPHRLLARPRRAACGGGRTTLPAPRRTLLRTAHVATSVSVLGADPVLLALGIAGPRGAGPQTVYPAAHLAAAWLVRPLADAALGTGLLLGVLTPWGLLRYWWVALTLAATAGLTAAVVLVPGLGAAAAAATGPAARPFTAAERVPLVAAPAVASTLLTLSVGLAVFKPGGRLRGRGGARPCARRTRDPGRTVRLRCG